MSKVSAKATGDLGASGSEATFETGNSPHQLELRLAKLEHEVSNTLKHDKSRPSPVTLEIAKLLFGGWSAFAIIFVLVFYSELKGALGAIPDKVRNAEEIGLVGITVKSSLKREAARFGVDSVADSLPNLTPESAEFLIKNSRSSLGNISGWRFNEREEVNEVVLPDQRLIAILSDLEKNGFTTSYAKLGNQTFTGISGIRQAIETITKTYPGTWNDYKSGDEIGWTLNSPIKQSMFPRHEIVWEFTNLGKAASDVLLRTLIHLLKPEDRKSN